jgi:hypothetical protein
MGVLLVFAMLRWALTSTAVLILAGPARGQGLDPAPGGAAEAALAGASVLAVKDATSLWRNPAGLASAGGGVIVSLGLQNPERSVLRKGPDPLPEARDVTGVQLAPAVAVTLPLGPIHLGLGYRTGLLSHSTYAELIDKTNRRVDPGYLSAATELRQHLVSFGVAMRWRRLLIGASVELSHLRLEHRRLLWAGLQGNALQDVAWDLRSELSVHDTLSVAGLFGARLRLLRWLELGFAVRTPTDTRLSGELDLTPAAANPKPPAGFAKLDTEGGSAELDLTLPLTLRGGLTLRFPAGTGRHSGFWRLAAHLEVSHARWSTGALSAELDGPAILLTDSSDKTERRPLPRLDLGLRLESHTGFHAGLELDLFKEYVTVRAGYAFHNQSTPSELPSPTLLDLQRHVLGLGLEARRGLLRLALAVQHSFRTTLEASGEEALLENPIAPEVTEPVGQGRYASSLTRVVVEAGLSW